MHQTFEKSSLEMTHKLDDMIELPKSLPKKTYKEDLKCEMVMVGNPSAQSTPQILPSFEEYTPPVTYPEEVEETLGTPIEIEPFDQMKIEDVFLDTCNHDIPLSSKEVPNFDEPVPQPQPLPSCPSLDQRLMLASQSNLQLVLSKEKYLDVVELHVMTGTRKVAHAMPWNVMGTDVVPITSFQDLALCASYVSEESDKVEKLDCWSSAATNNQRTLTCYECGNQGHYKSDCSELKNGNQVGGVRTRGMMLALVGGEPNQDLDDMEDNTNA
ncbi:ribonuclease H-like domain-containing protein [Tanacetum coccineum]